MAYRGENSVGDTVQIWNGSSWVSFNNLLLTTSGADAVLTVNGAVLELASDTSIYLNSVGFVTVDSAVLTMNSTGNTVQNIGGNSLIDVDGTLRQVTATGGTSALNNQSGWEQYNFTGDGAVGSRFQISNVPLFSYVGSGSGSTFQATSVGAINLAGAGPFSTLALSAGIVGITALSTLAISVGGSPGTAGQVLQSNGTNAAWATPASPTPPGSNRQVIFNNAGAFGANAGLSYLEPSADERILAIQSPSAVPAPPSAASISFRNFAGVEQAGFQYSEFANFLLCQLQTGNNFQVNAIDGNVVLSANGTGVADIRGSAGLLLRSGGIDSDQWPATNGTVGQVLAIQSIGSPNVLEWVTPAGTPSMQAAYDGGPNIVGGASDINWALVGGANYVLTASGAGDFTVTGLVNATIQGTGQPGSLFTNNGFESQNSSGLGAVGSVGDFSGYETHDLSGTGVAASTFDASGHANIDLSGNGLAATLFDGSGYENVFLTSGPGGGTFDASGHADLVLTGIAAGDADISAYDNVTITGTGAGDLTLAGWSDFLVTTSALGLDIGGSPGTAGQVLTSDGTYAVWADPTGAATTLQGAYDAGSAGIAGEIVSDATQGPFDFTGTESFSVTTDGSANITPSSAVNIVANHDSAPVQIFTGSTGAQSGQIILATGPANNNVSGRIDVSTGDVTVVGAPTGDIGFSTGNADIATGGNSGGYRFQIGHAGSSVGQIQGSGSLGWLFDVGGAGGGGSGGNFTWIGANNSGSGGFMSLTGGSGQQGGGFSFTGGAGTNGPGGSFTAFAGSGTGAASPGGNIQLQAGNAETNAGSGTGDVLLQAGSGTGAGNINGGNVQFLGGSGINAGAGGFGELRGGLAGVTGAGGLINIQAADGGATSGNGGSTNMQSGSATVGDAGDMSFTSGSSASGDGGNISFVTGTGTGTNGVFLVSSSGDVQISAAADMELTALGNAQIDITGTLALIIGGTPGTAGQVLTSDGTNAAWDTPAVGGYPYSVITPVAATENITNTQINDNEITVAFSVFTSRLVNIPSPATVNLGSKITIKDSAGTAATENITITSALASSIDGTTSKTIATAYGSMTLQAISATAWAVI